jgi:hypothetical protein
VNGLSEIVQQNSEGVTTRPKTTIPPLRKLVAAPLIANGLIVSFLLMEKHLLLALGITGGALIGLIIFSSLHYFAENIFGLLIAPSAGTSSGAPGGLMMLGVLTGGKFILVGALMFLMVAVMHLNVIAFVIGFFVTQICVSISVINRLAKSKVTD